MTRDCQSTVDTSLVVEAAYSRPVAEAGIGRSSDEQLAAIASLSSILDERRIEYWLFGGWAVDFWVGDVTREHDDIDVAAWREDYDAIGAALEGAGWRHTPVANEVVGTRYRLGRAEAEFTFVVADSEGRILVPMTEQPIVWSAESFGDHRLTLGGVNSRTIPLALLRAGKAMSRAGAADAAKDRADFEALSQLKV
jgi:hypothetical protein